MLPRTKLPRTKSVIALSVLAAASIALAGPVSAQSYPDRAIELIVPFPPGGGNDVIARIMAQELRGVLGQQVVINNVAGANGSIGLQQLTRAASDGYTLAVAAAGPMAVNPHLYDDLTYDPTSDFAPISNLVNFPLLLVTHPSLEAETVEELVEYARANPGAISYASPGIGNSGHLAGALLGAMADVDILHIPYSGQGPAVADLLGGHVSMLFSSIPSVIAYARDGDLNSLAIGSAERLDALPDVPTVDESGVPGFEAYSWVGLVAPLGTPDEVIATLNAAVREILERPEVSQLLAEQGAVPEPTTPEEFELYIVDELAKWGEVIETTGISAE